MNEKTVLPLDDFKLTNKIIVLVGSSGSGKTTLAQVLNERLKIKQLVTTTTRPMRKDENHGVDYYFVGNSKFSEMFYNDEFIETNQYSGYLYGLSHKEIRKNRDKLCLLITDVNGARAIADAYPERVMVFWLRSTPTLMINRLINRGENITTVISRLINALRDKEFRSPYRKFNDVAFTELLADSTIDNNFGIIYYKLLISEYSRNETYLRYLESEQTISNIIRNGTQI